MTTMEKNQAKLDKKSVGRSEFATRDSEVRPMDTIYSLKDRYIHSLYSYNV